MQTVLVRFEKKKTCKLFLLDLKIKKKTCKLFLLDLKIKNLTCMQLKFNS